MKKIILFFIILAFLTLMFSVYMFTLYPVSYMDIIIKNSKEYDVDPYLIASIINVESRYDPDAESNKLAKGLMQITPSTGQWASELIGIPDYSEEKLFIPDINIKIGSWYIDRLIDEFDGDVSLALAAYNAGSGNVNKWLEDESYSSDGRSLHTIPFKETDEYIKKINKNYQIYSKLYKKFFKEDGICSNSYMLVVHSIKKIIDNIKG